MSRNENKRKKIQKIFYIVSGTIQLIILYLIFSDALKVGAKPICIAWLIFIFVFGEIDYRLRIDTKDLED